MNGYFDNQRLYINVEVSGAVLQGIKTLKAQIDTGYDGYLSLPLPEAFPLGLALVGTKGYTIADGSTVTNLVCLGNITINGQKNTVPIDILPNGSILLGISLLPKLGDNLEISFAKKQIRLS